MEHTDKLNSDCLGALVSLTFNRGAGTYTKAGDRYEEMHQIRQCMKDQNFAPIPDLILHMRRLWPKSSGLWDRRQREAKFFADGLAHMPPAG